MDLIPFNFPELPIEIQCNIISNMILWSDIWRINQSSKYLNELTRNCIEIIEIDEYHGVDVNYLIIFRNVKRISGKINFFSRIENPW